MAKYDRSSKQSMRGTSVLTSDKSSARPASSSVALYVIALIVFIVSAAALVLMMVTLMVNSFVNISVSENMYAKIPAVVPTSPLLLIPQLDASIGLTRACLSGGRCPNRNDISGVSPLLPDKDAIVAALASEPKLAKEYEQVYSQFYFGYDIAEPCGTSSGTVASLSKFALASGILSVLCFCAVAVMSTFLFVLLTRIDVLVGVATIDVEAQTVRVGEDNIDVEYMLHEIDVHRRYEKGLLIAMAIMAALSAIWSLCLMAVEVSLVMSTMKCGQSVCTAFRDSMKALMNELEAAGSSTTGYETNCSLGASYVVSAVCFILAVIILALTLVLFLVYYWSCRGRRLSERKRLLELKQKDLLSQIAMEETRRQRTRQSLILKSRQISIAATELEQELEEKASGSLTSSRKMLSCEHVERKELDRSVVGYASAAFPTLGAGIALVKQQKKLTDKEMSARDALERLEAITFDEMALLSCKVTHAEGLLALHESTLSWSFAPALDLHVVETFYRQKLIERYQKRLRDIVEKNSSLLPPPSHGMEGRLRMMDPRVLLHACASHYSLAATQGIKNAPPPTEKWLDSLADEPAPLLLSQACSLGRRRAASHNGNSATFVSLSLSSNTDMSSSMERPATGIRQVPFTSTAALPPRRTHVSPTTSPSTMLGRHGGVVQVVPGANLEKRGSSAPERLSSLFFTPQEQQKLNRANSSVPHSRPTSSQGAQNSGRSPIIVRPHTTYVVSSAYPTLECFADGPLIPNENEGSPGSRSSRLGGGGGTLPPESIPSSQCVSNADSSSKNLLCEPTPVFQ